MTNTTRTQTTSPSASQARAAATPNQVGPSGCCGGPAPIGTDACCAQDAEVKSAGAVGCGCGTSAPRAAAHNRTPCCS